MSRRNLLAAALALGCLLLLAATGWLPAGPPEPLVAKPGQEVSFSLAEGGAAEQTFEIAKVLRDSRQVKVPQGLAFDAKAGKVSWTPRPSQAGHYELKFLVYDRRHPQGREVLRRIDVRPAPVTTDRGTVGKLLERWFNEGTAAGNVGDFYDNRDRGHSGLNMGKFPQLEKVEYPKELLDRRLDWGLQRSFVFPHVTFGNSSTASGATAAGSNSRWSMLGQRMAEVMYRQYTSNHLYIYPEHRDHDPGRNGRGGHGDLFPANTPYLITSQGSSGSDRSFMEAVAFTLAAFRPEVKRRLVETGLLMPTVQMVLRACAKGVRYPDDYLKGQCHPTVFEGAGVDVEAMVRMAHGIAADAVPPTVQLTVEEEDQAVGGRDYFDPGRDERLFDTPAAVARIVRSTKHVRRMVVSAVASYDLNGRALTYHWSVLRGDADRIKVRPLNKDSSRVELLVPYHECRPIEPGSQMLSPRVDVGCFVHNGKYHSAPGFVTLYSLAWEARTYGEDGRILEMAYDYGDSTLGYPASDVRGASYDITDWGGLLELAVGKEDSLGARLLRGRLTEQALGVLRPVARELAGRAAGTEAGPTRALAAARAARDAARAAEAEAKKRLDAAKAAHAKAPTDQSRSDVAERTQALKEAGEARQAAEKAVGAAQRTLDDVRRNGNGVLTKAQPRLAGRESVKDRLEKVLNEIKDDPGLYFDRPEEIERLARDAKDAARKRAFAAAREELVRLGVAADDGKGVLHLTPAVGGEAPPRQRLTRHERNRLEWFGVAILRELLYPGMLNLSYRREFVDPRLSTARNWRDVYHYDEAGRRTGWTRYEKGKRTEFTADGAAVETTDKLGRALTARAVQYLVDRDPRGRLNEVRYTTLPTARRYEYASDADRVGQVRE